MWELDYEESWAPKIWCFWTVVLENTLESPLDSKEIKPVGRTDAEAPHLMQSKVQLNSWPLYVLLEKHD